ncbi:MAG: hypothetical protein IJ366_10305 [Clostridia bacterium]|nr:hypothetical protein [Clostridia bacterium]
MNNELNTTENMNESGERFTNEIAILDVIVLMMRNWWMISMVGLVLAVACYAYSKSASVPTYVSTGSLYIDTQREQITDDVNATALSHARDLMPTYIEILESRSFNMMVSDAMDNKYSYEQINKMIELSQVEETNIMTLSVECVDELDSYIICNHAINLASEEILRVFEGGSVKIIDTPKEDPQIIVVNLFQRGVIGFVVGAILATIAIVLFDIFDTRIVSSDELTSRYKLPVLGEIPNLADLS